MVIDLITVSLNILSVYFVMGFIMLSLGAHWFIDGAIDLSIRFNVSKLLIGSVIMSLATTSPELIVSLTAAADGQIWIALGNVFGSYIANIGLVLGIAGLIRPIKVSYIILHRQLPFCISALMLLLILSLSTYFEAMEACILLGLMGLWLFWLFVYAKKDDCEFDLPEPDSNIVMVIKFIVGIISLQLGASILVASAESAAIQLGVPPYAIGLTVVAIGTSLPELASAVMGSIKGEFELVLGNILGANILLILMVLPLSVLLSTNPVSLANIWRDYFFMGALSAFLWVFSTRFDYSWQINRIEAMMLLVLFLVYQVIVLQVG